MGIVQKFKVNPMFAETIKQKMEKKSFKLRAESSCTMQTADEPDEKASAFLNSTVSRFMPVEHFGINA